MWPGPSLPKACFCAKQSPEAPETTDALPCPVQGPQQDPDPAQARVVLHQERDPHSRPSGEARKRLLLVVLSAVGGVGVQGAVGAGPR